MRWTRLDKAGQDWTGWTRLDVRDARDKTGRAGRGWMGLDEMSSAVQRVQSSVGDVKKAVPGVGTALFS